MGPPKRKDKITKVQIALCKSHNYHIRILPPWGCRLAGRGRQELISSNCFPLVFFLIL